MTSDWAGIVETNASFYNLKILMLLNLQKINTAQIEILIHWA